MDGGRQALATEADPPEDEADDSVDADEDLALEEILQTEADILAAESEEAVNECVDAHLIEDLEESVEGAAEASITMKEARIKLNEVKRDRGYGKVGSGSSSLKKALRLRPRRSQRTHALTMGFQDTGLEMQNVVNLVLV